MPEDDLPDARVARLRFARAAQRPAHAPDTSVQRIAARRLAERLDFLKIAPQRWLDAGCGAGEDMAELRRRYPAAEVIGLDNCAPSVVRNARATPWGDRLRSFLGRPSSRFVCADMARLPFADSSFDAVWSNLALSWISDPAQAFAEFRRVLLPGGLLTFCTYGPDTLNELRQAFGGIDSHSHAQRFIDMHDLGDLLVAGGFAAPVMDMDIVTFTYPSLAALVAELRASGQTHVGARRRRGLLGKDAWRKVEASYEKRRREGRIPATVELVFGHAWKPQQTYAPGVAPIRFQR